MRREPIVVGWITGRALGAVVAERWAIAVPIRKQVRCSDNRPYDVMSQTPGDRVAEMAAVVVCLMMAESDEAFEEFFSRTEPRLRRALCATYGASTGRAATVDALGWAWENWSRLRRMKNPTGYLYRVGQSASRRYASDRLPVDRASQQTVAVHDPEPRLAEALAKLSEQQRTVALLVHGFHWRKSEVAVQLGVTESTVSAHLARAMTNIRNSLEAQHERRQ